VDQPDEPPALAVITSRESSPTLSPNDCRPGSLGFRLARGCRNNAVLPVSECLVWFIVLYSARKSKWFHLRLDSGLLVNG
jgi:hypothetical protein